MKPLKYLVCVHVRGPKDNRVADNSRKTLPGRAFASQAGYIALLEINTSNISSNREDRRENGLLEPLPRRFVWPRRAIHAGRLLSVRGLLLSCVTPLRTTSSFCEHKGPPHIIRFCSQEGGNAFFSFFSSAWQVRPRIQSRTPMNCIFWHLFHS